MVNFRPYIMQATILGDSVYDQDLGKYVTPDPTFAFHQCNASPNGSGKTTRTEDGNSIVYSYLIHANLDCPLYPYGTDISILDDGEVIASGKVVNKWKNGANTRIWL